MTHLRRWGLLWLAVGMAAMLLASTVWTHVGLIRFTDDFAAIHFAYLRSELPPDTSDLEATLHTLRPLGVDALSRFDADGDWMESAGDPVDPEGRSANVQERIGQGRHRGEVREATGTLVVEYKPLVAMDMRRRNSVGIALSGIAGVLLIGLTAAWVRHRLQQEAQARQAERTRQLAQMGVLSAVVAHELRNPLTVLLGHVQLLREDLPDDRSVKHVEEGALRLDALLDSLLRFAKTGEVTKEPTNPTTLLQEAARDVGIELPIEGEAPSCMLDPMRMRQVLVNLVRNAHAASPQGVTARVAFEDGTLEIAIEDQGPGIPAGAHETIFEPFYTTRIHGTGLGLAVARDIVTKHGGTLTAEDAPGGGALFLIRVNS